MSNSNSKSPSTSPVILHVLPSLKTVGGVEKNTLETVFGLQLKGFGHHHIASEGVLPSSLLNHISHADPIVHHNLRLTSKNPWHILINAFLLKRIIQEKQINIIHARSRAPAWSALLAAKLTGIPFVTTYHGAYSCGSALKKWYNSVMVRGDVTIAISAFIRAHIQKQYPDCESIMLIPEGIDVDYFNPTNISAQRLKAVKKLCHITSDLPAILVVGRVTPLKGHMILAKALENLPHQNYQVICVGSTMGKKKYADLVRDACQHLPVTFIENWEDMPALYYAAEVVISCSTQPESFGRSIAEGLVMGKKVIATDHGGALELSNDGEFATLVPPQDVHALSTAILNALNDTQDRQSQISDQQNYIKSTFSIHVMVDKIQSLYHTLHTQKVV